MVASVKTVIAIDSLKGSLSSLEAGTAIKKGIQHIYPSAEIIVKPIADGGEGTVEALITGLNGEYRNVTVSGPDMKPVSCQYGTIDAGKTAIIEMAGAAGITLLEESKRNPLHATTYGVGEVILDAIASGCRDFVIGIGGSATNDGGIGMLEALGYSFFDDTGAPVGALGCDLACIRSISDANVPMQLRDCRFHIACDVTNPLCGETGATYTYAPQKGGTPEMLEQLEKGMHVYADAVKDFTNKDYSKYPGAGAAGGLGFAFLAFLNAQLLPGVSVILDAINLEEDIQDADYVITGEGRLDSQTVMGKVPSGVAKLAKKYNKTVIAFSGCATPDASICNDAGIDAYFPILQMPMTTAFAMQKQTAYQNMVSTVTQVFSLIHRMT